MSSEVEEGYRAFFREKFGNRRVPVELLREFADAEGLGSAGIVVEILLKAIEDGFSEQKLVNDVELLLKKLSCLNWVDWRNCFSDEVPRLVPNYWPEGFPELGSIVSLTAAFPQSGRFEKVLAKLSNIGEPSSRSDSIRNFKLVTLRASNGRFHQRVLAPRDLVLADEEQIAKFRNEMK